MPSLNRHLCHYYFPFTQPSSAYTDNDNEWNAHYLGWSCRSGNSYRGLVGGTKGEESSVCPVSFLPPFHHNTVIILPSCLSISLSYRLSMRSNRIHSLRSFVTINNCAPLMIRLIRTSVALTLTCTYLMWAITYLAQLHPLIGELSFHSLIISWSPSVSVSVSGLLPFPVEMEEGRNTKVDKRYRMVE